MGHESSTITERRYIHLSTGSARTKCAASARSQAKAPSRAREPGSLGQSKLTAEAMAFFD